MNCGDDYTVSQEVLMAFKRSRPNYNLPDKVPVANGYLYDNLLIIRRCPLCGYPHTHTTSGKNAIGYLTIRVNHCSGRSEFGKEYIIKVTGRMNEEQYEKTFKTRDNPQKIGPVKCMSSSDYIALCEERGSWI